MLLAINDIVLMFIGLAVMVLLFASFFIALHNMRRRQVALRLLQKQKEETERQKQMLEQALGELQSAQAQLIQREKMASLGELTAGIAHEIQNPLNFVKNFSEVTTELVDELHQQLSSEEHESLEPTALAIKENLKMIAYHSGRASSIIKSMMMHSRASAGRKEPTDIHVLIEEFSGLSYHGLKAKDKLFNATIRKDFDPQAGKILVIPEDIGRVLLNLFNNAFYSVNEKKARQEPGYEPTVWVKTTKYPAYLEISIRDNGAGIPPALMNKIFHPFFTTKPTGQGTGLGLSLSYDVIKAHNGELKVESKEGEGAEFKILLPYQLQ